MKRNMLLLVIFALFVVHCLSFLGNTYAEGVPAKINYQGYLTGKYTGPGQIKIAIVSENGKKTCWSNDGTSVNGAEPNGAIGVDITDGFFSVVLGDTGINNMKELDKGVFATGEKLFYRVWIKAETDKFEILSPDQEIVASPFAISCDSTNSTKNADMVDNQHYNPNWPTTLNNVKNACTNDFHKIGGVDDDQPDSDAEVPDNISIDNGFLYTKPGNNSVGIGTKIPTTTLDVNGTVKAKTFIGDGSKLTGIQAQGAVDADWAISGLNIYRNYGNVGIGTTTPMERLDVAGTARAYSLRANSIIGDELGIRRTVRARSVVSDELFVSGTARAGSFIGDGSRLTGISSGPKIYSRIASNFIVTDSKNFVPMYDMRIEENFPAGQIYIHFNSVFSSPIDKIYGQVAIFVDGAMVSNNTVNITSKYPSDVPLSTDRVVAFSSPGRHTIEIRWRTCSARTFYQIHGDRTLTIIAGK